MADTRIVFRATELLHDVISSFVELTAGLNILDLQFTEAYLGLYFRTVICTQLRTVFQTLW